MLPEIALQACRNYTIPYPACGTDNEYPRFKRDIYRVRTSEPDGHPLEMSWVGIDPLPPWVTPLTFFWGTCRSCYYSAQLDDADFRQWKKSAKKYLSQYSDGALEKLLGAGLKPETDPFGTMLVQFFLGIFVETLKSSPAPSTLARCYLRIAWLYRDQERLYGSLASTDSVFKLLSEVAPLWEADVPENSNYPVVPGVPADEVSALRYTLSYFDWNFGSLQKAGHEDEMRLMTLIAEIGYRIYELTGDEEDFKKAQNSFSGTMQKSLSVINDKNIVGGAVNRSKEILENAGDRGRELRSLKEKLDKLPPDQRPAAASSPPPPAADEPSETTPESPSENDEFTAENAPQEQVAAPQSSSGSSGDLHKKLAQLGEENKRWMRLAGMSDVTGLPNRVMLSRVLLPGAIKEAVARKQPLGCIFISPSSLSTINGKYGRAFGDTIIKEFSLCLKALLKRNERLCHLEGVNFAIVVPAAAPHQLKKRAESLHKELSSRRYTHQGESLSLEVSIGAACLESARGTPQSLKDSLYQRAITALDTAKFKGTHIEVQSEPAPARS